MSDWIKVVNSLPAHPKIVRAGDRAAWLYVCGLCYANEHLTDGYIPRDVLVVAAPGVKSPERLAAQLVAVGLWHDADGGWQIHDYADHQRTSEQVRERREKDRARKAKKESDTTFRADSARNPDGVRAASANREEKRREEENPPAPQGAKVVTFRRRPVPAERLSVAESALAAFNQHTGQNVSPYRSDGRPSEALTRILGAVTDKPDKLTADYCQRLVADTIRRQWWGNDPASIGVVFGPNVIDRNIAALDGAHKRPVSSVELAERLRGGAA